MAFFLKAPGCCSRSGRVASPMRAERPQCPRHPCAERRTASGCIAKECNAMLTPEAVRLEQDDVSTTDSGDNPSTSTSSSNEVEGACDMHSQSGSDPACNRPLGVQHKEENPANFRNAVHAVVFIGRLSKASAANHQSKDQEPREFEQRFTLVETSQGRTHGRARSLSVSKTTMTTDGKVAQLMDLLEPGHPLGHFSDLAKEYVDAAYCRRLLRKYQGDVAKSSQRLKEAMAWREQNKVVLTTRKFAHGGDYRVLGTDVTGRPVLYMCMKNQLLSVGQGIDQNIVCMLQAVDNMPAGVESAIHVWDLHGMMMYLNMNPAPLLQIVKTWDSYFAERMQELIIIDTPRTAIFLKDIAWPLVPERTRNKIKFMTLEAALLQMQTEFEPQTCARITACMQQNRDRNVSLEERQRTWMRVDKDGELVPAFT
mmetsp:Transcript_141459/g.451772  ORF Transcript_141459/g.451772 Transcript_141459/m.451772 type:complete len:426 (-) Transcript_141459:81-1358(-)